VVHWVSLRFHHPPTPGFDDREAAVSVGVPTVDRRRRRDRRSWSMLNLEALIARFVADVLAPFAAPRLRICGT
jgi:hypothetical protein